jgi:hypothetical protein
VSTQLSRKVGAWTCQLVTHDRLYACFCSELRSFSVVLNRVFLASVCMVLTSDICASEI